MASPALLDLDALTAPIPGESPAGAPLPYDVRLKLEELRKEINPDDYDADDPRRPTQYRKPDWPAIVQLATDTLSNTSKDLLAAVRLTEALTIEKGAAGLRDGLDLLSRLAAQCWDRLYPTIEEGESPEAREGPFKWLNQNGYGAQFPVTLRHVALLTVNGREFNFLDWQNTQRRGAFEAAIGEATAEQCQDLVDDLTTAREKMQALSSTLHERMGEIAPDLDSSENTENLGAALNDCLKVAKQILQRKSGVPAGADELGANSGAGGSEGGSISRSMASRAEAYRLLNEAAELLQKLEPHSPIPYLVKRAVKLGELKFPDLMRALIRETAVLDELDRLMGLTAAPAEGS